ncbi:MAG: aminopeptidase P family protein, partial [Clostridia bacterium]|nr:aminopeptidase P family protein [Clostridia bacterium]
MNSIPKREYGERMLKFQKNIRAAGLDAVLVHGNEADFANVRYLSEYWPTFEAGGVFVPARGQPVLIIGPESENYARGRSLIPSIEKMVEYRESAEPEYPGISVASYKDVVKRSGMKKPPAKLGLVGYSIMTLPVYTRLKKDFPAAKLVKADDTLISLRIIKSRNEIKLMQEAYIISEKAIDAILKEIKPGMTELQVIGIAQREIYKHGGEYEGHALYCFCGLATNNAISRP